MYLYKEGNHYDIYKKLGAHLTEINGHAGATFAVWAPNAQRVSIVGDFNGWDGRCHPMRKRIEAGIWEIFIPAWRKEPTTSSKCETASARSS